jgi:hypothetical protein
LAAALNNGDTFDELVHGVLPGRGNEISVAAHFDSICVPPEASNRFARPWAAAGPGVPKIELLSALPPVAQKFRALRNSW